jgi:MinD superfamily P-loop ATPase
MQDQDKNPEPGANPAFDRIKARRAARRPDRPRERCRAEAAAYEPRVDHGRCEGKRDRVEVCPESAITRVHRSVGS